MHFKNVFINAMGSLPRKFCYIYVYAQDILLAVSVFVTLMLIQRSGLDIHDPLIIDAIAM